MRVVAGKARGLKLSTIEGNSTRPTKDMVKEALFSIISDKVYDSVFLDLFAGSGAIGIEALSRGAKEAVFVDNNKDCIKVINENLSKAKMAVYSTICNMDYITALNKLNDRKFDIIFIDPPYNKGMGVLAIEKVSQEELLADGGIIVYESDKVEVVPEVIGRYKRYNYKKYGRNILNFYSMDEWQLFYSWKGLLIWKCLHY